MGKSCKIFVTKILACLLCLAIMFGAASCATGAAGENGSGDSGNGDGNGGGGVPMVTDKIFATVAGNKLEVTLASNVAVVALVELLSKGDIVIEANDYGNFEKVGTISHALPTNDQQIRASSGDILLYSGSSICFFYGSNSYSYTRIGRINGYSESQLRELMQAGKGSVNITLGMR